MTLSGALGGLAGVSYFCGYYASIQPGVVPSMGFDAIAVCLLGGIHPVGCVFSSFLITVISKGTTYLSSRQGVEVEIASLITAVILVFAACSEFLRDWVNRAAQESQISQNSQNLQNLSGENNNNNNKIKTASGKGGGET